MFQLLLKLSLEFTLEPKLSSHNVFWSIRNLSFLASFRKPLVSMVHMLWLLQDNTGLLMSGSMRGGVVWKCRTCI